MLASEDRWTVWTRLVKTIFKMFLVSRPSFLFPEQESQFRSLLTPQHWSNILLSRQGIPGSVPTAYTWYSNLPKAQLWRHYATAKTYSQHSLFPTDVCTSSLLWLLNPLRLSSDWLTHPYLHYCLTLSSYQPDTFLAVLQVCPMLSPCHDLTCYFFCQV